MVRTGEVVEKTGDVLSVVFERPDACAHCSGCIHKRCSRVDIRGEAEVGDTIDVHMPDKSIVSASAIFYLLPLVLLLAGLLAGTRLHVAINLKMNGDVFAALCGLLCLALGLLIVYAVDRVLRKRQAWQPKIKAVHKRDA
ncbi:MAG: SoxR reducing system RseC family protein [Firmicutes bacterium]|nr:SoxR reducing system RseC family protein [Bacillota bacterium]